MWGCPHGDDDTQHYAACRRLAAVADDALGLQPIRNPRSRAEDFLLRPGAQEDMGSLVTKALCLTAAYRLHSRWRCDCDAWARLPPRGRLEAFRQATFDFRRGVARQVGDSRGDEDERCAD